MKFVFLLISLFISATAHALDNDRYYKVDHVYSWKNGEAHVWLERKGGDHACKDKTYPNRYLMSRDTVTEFDQKFSLILSAKVSGQPVKFQYYCDSSDRAFISSVRF